MDMLINRNKKLRKTFFFDPKIDLLFVILSFVLFVALILLLPMCFPNMSKKMVLAFRKLDNPSNHLFFMNNGYRNTALYNSYIGLKKTGIPLLAARLTRLNGAPNDETDFMLYLPESHGDDLGHFYFIPKMINLISPNITYPPKKVFRYQVTFYVIIVALGWFIGCLGFYFLINNALMKWVAFIYWSCISFYCLYILDVYSFQFFAASLIPGILHISRRCVENDRYLLFYAFILFLGFVIGVSNVFRIQAATGVLIFALTYVLFLPLKNFSMKKKVAALLILLVSTGSVVFHLNHVKNKRDEWLRKNGHEGLLEKPIIGKHVIWHAVYLGLGYIPNNKYGIKWLDSYGYEKAKSIDAAVTSPAEVRYEDALRKEVMRILRYDFQFIVKTMLLKSLVILLYLAVFMNIGAVFLFISSPSYKILLPFLFAISYSVLPGILVWPFPMYFLGGLSLSVILCIIAINNFYNRHQVNKNFNSYFNHP